MAKRTVIITAKVSERPGGGPDLLAARPEVELRLETLPLGDYLLGEGVVAERKTGPEFAASIVDRRLFAQAAALQEACPRALILLEGDPPAPGRSRIHANVLLGARSDRAVMRGLTVPCTVGPRQSADLLATIAKQLQVGYRQPEGPTKRRAAGLTERQEADVC